MILNPECRTSLLIALFDLVQIDLDNSVVDQGLVESGPVDTIGVSVWAQVAGRVDGGEFEIDGFVELEVDGHGCWGRRLLAVEVGKGGMFGDGGEAVAAENCLLRGGAGSFVAQVVDIVIANHRVVLLVGGMGLSYKICCGIERRVRLRIT